MSEDAISADSGLGSAVTNVERAGNAPPETPTGNGLDRLLPDLLGGVEGVQQGYLVRIRFSSGDPRSTARQLVDALERQVDVHGETSDAGFDPSSPVLDAFVETDYESGAIARSLARLRPVEGVLVADVTDAAEGVLEDGAEDADAAGANDVFQELKEQVNQLGYGDVVDELEDVSFPGGPDPDEEIDLEAETGIDLGEDDGATAGTDPASPGETFDLDGNDTLDLDDGGDSSGGADSDDELDIRGLLKEDDGGDEDDGTVSEADEEAVSEAIRGIELDSGTDDEDETTSESRGEDSPGDGDQTSTGDGTDALDDIPAPRQPSRGSSNRKADDVDSVSNGSPDARADPGRGAHGDANVDSTEQGSAGPPETASGSADASGSSTESANASGSSTESADASGSSSESANASGSSSESANASGSSSESADASRSSSGSAGSGTDEQSGGEATGAPERALSDEKTGRVTPEEMDAFVANLIEALDSGAVSSDRRAELREALDVGNTHSLDVRLEYLQKRVDNLAAYTDAWEGFLSEEGTGREFIDDVGEDLADLEERMEAIEAGGGATGQEGADLASVEHRLSRLEETLGSVDDRLTELQRRHDEDVTRLDTRMDSVEATSEQRLDAVEDAIGSVKERVEGLLEWREHVNDVLSRRGD